MMRNKILIAIGLIGLIVLAVIGNQFLDINPTPDQVVNSGIQTSQPLADQNPTIIITPADAIEVVNFFGTQRCVACITVGKLAKQTIEEKFPEEVKTGKIVFREINGEMLENKEMMIKYQARGSSLFINAIRGDQDNIAEDVTVWRLVSNETQFINYFENKLKKLLGK